MLLILRHLCQGMTPISIMSIFPVRRYLSWKNEQRCRGLLEASANRYRQEAASAAVLVSLCSVAGEPAILYTLRSSTLSGMHKGDVRTHRDHSLSQHTSSHCIRLDPQRSIETSESTVESFPGGRCDDSDRDVIATALRETREELGLQLGEDSVWGIMRPLPDLTKKIVIPVLANLGPLEQLILKPNPKEVEAVFTLSISHLLKEENQGYTHFCRSGVYSYTMPVFPRGPHRVWGLTAIITELTLELLAPGKYQRRTRVVGSR